MKYIFIVFSLFCFWINLETGFAMTYKDTIILHNHPAKINTSSNINRAKLLSIAVTNFQKNIFKLSSKYEIQGKENVVNAIKTTDLMYEVSVKIQTLHIDKKKADEIIHSIVQDMDKLNQGLKQYFRSQIDEIDVYHKRSIHLAREISQQLDKLTDALEKRIHSKKILLSRDKEMLQHVQKLKKTSKKLYKFDEFEFYKKSEIKATFIRLIKQVKKEIEYIQTL
jgi:hypothetical protein